MKREVRTVVMTAGTLALAAVLAYAGTGSVSAQEAFAPYYEDYTRGEPIPPEQLKKIEHAKPLLAPQESAPRAVAVKARPGTPRKAVKPAAAPVQAVHVAPLPKSDR